ncbi:MAG TPA: hypothetical protein VMH33_01885 [Solirubrobacterales bacterium]|nr:hypothetical protein [Solirubrobacterales bacterium]
MNHHALKTVRLALGLTVIALAVGVFAAAGSAAAATQHWATATPAAQIAEGNSKSFTGQNFGNVEMNWKYGGSTIIMNCTKLSTSGTASNPTGGGSGTHSPTSLELSGCTINIASCKIVNEVITFEAQKGYAVDEGSSERIRFEPYSGATMAVVDLANNGKSCSLAGEIRMTGYFEAIARAAQPGRYWIAGSPHLRMLEHELEVVAEFTLNASGQPLALSSEGSPGVPHWYLAPSEWTAIPTGKAVSYFSGAVPLTLSTKIGLAKVEISGCEGLNAGSVENPAGGGAGTASSTFTPAWASGCRVNVGSCVVKGTESIELVGKATEVGAVPAVEWTPKSGTAVMLFYLGNAPSKVCSLPGEIDVTGKLIATSEGDGHFDLAASELKVGTQTATAGGKFSLGAELGQSLRLQP